MKKRFIAFALSLALIFQCILILPTVSYAAYMTDNAGNSYTVEDLFEYTIIADNTYSCVIDKYKRINDPNITQISIPKKIDGVKVVEIGDGAFKNSRYLQEVYIPESITKIGDSAFYQARALKSITIPGSVVTVGEKAFYKCIKLEKATILYGVQSLGAAAFAYCISLREISVGSSAVPSNDETFLENKDLTISADPSAPIVNAEYANSKITKAELPDDSPAAYEYSVDENGEVTITRYKSENKNPIIPDKINGNPVSHLGEGSFKDTGIKTIKLPDTLKTIASNVFIGTELEEITIPSSVTALGDNFIEDKEGLVIKGDSKVVEDYVAGTQHIVFEPYGPGVSSYYKLEVSISGFGTVVGIKGGYVKGGKEIKISAKPSSGYEFKSWSLNGEGEIEDTSSSETVFTMPKANTKLIATFVKQKRPRLVIENGIVTEFNAYDDLVIPAMDNNKPVTGIDAHAFTSYSPYNHGNPSSLQIPPSLVDIPVAALNNCSNLKFIKVEAGNAKYKDIDGVLFTADGKTLVKYPAKKDLTQYSVPNGVTTIESGAFRDCDNLTKIILPSSVTTIKSSAFYSCSNLSQINIPDGVTSIESNTFYGCNSLSSLSLPNGIKSIGSGAFEYCSNLNNFVIPDGITAINSYVFRGCRNLSSLTVPSSVTSIGSYAFEDCDSLNSIDIFGNIKSIGSNAFEDCDGFNSITIPNSVTSIGSYAFRYCNNLTQINIGSNVLSIGYHAFYSCPSLVSINVDASNANYSDDSGVLYELKEGKVELLIYPMSKSGTTYSIRNDTTSIADSAFYNRDSLTEINLNSSSLSTIASNAFYGCDGISEITIPQAVASIGSLAFYNCSKLESIDVDENNTSYTSNGEGVLLTHSKDRLLVYPMARTADSYSIPKEVKTIDSYAFANSSNLVNIDVPEDVSYIGDRAFQSCTKLENIEIPEKVTTINDYIVSGCSNLKSITVYNKDALIKCPHNGYNYDDSFGGIDKSKVTMRGHLDSTAEEYAFMYNMKFEQIDKVSDGLLVDDKGILYGYTGKDLDVILSTNIKQIGHDAFKNPNDVNDKTYEQIKSIKFPLSVRAFEPYAFDGCNSITSLNVTRAVYDIQKSAFNGCSNLVEINVNPSNTTYKSIGGKDGKGNGILTDHASSIIKEVANGYKGPEGDGKYTVPADITGIESGAFAGCSLTELIMQNTEYIAVDAFKGAFRDSNININLSNVVDIDNGAFADCTGISEITLPDTLERLGDNVFDGCTNLKNITVEAGNKKYFDDKGVLYVHTKLPDGYDNPDTINPIELVLYPLGRTDDTYKILDDTIGIYDNAFNNCKSIKSIDIPDSVFYIGQRAFNGCSISGNLTLPKYLNRIEAYAFANNELLAEVSIPKTVISIATGAFTNCSRLYKATIYNDNLKFGTEGKIFDEEKNDFGDNQLTIYGNKGSTSEKYVVGRNINFEVLGKDKNKISITLNAVGNPNATVDLTPDQAKSVIQSVYSDKSNEIELNINVSSSVYSISTNLPKSLISSINSIANSQGNSDNQFDLTINTPIANISLDKEAIAKIDSNSSSSDIRIIVKDIDVSTLNIPSDDKAKIGNRPIVGVEIISGNNIYDLRDGVATISIPYYESSGVQVLAISNGSLANQSFNSDFTNKYLVILVSMIDSVFAVSKTN